MRTAVTSWKHHYRERATAFVLTMILVAALVGCTTVHELPDRCDLIVSSTAGGGVAEPGEGLFDYDYGAVVSLVAEADTGYEFINWEGDVGNVEDVDAASTAITMNGDYSITANFEVIPIVECDLTISSTSGGSVTAPGEGVFTYDSDAVVDLVAVADECYEFVHWTGDAVADPFSASTSIFITIGGDAAKAVTANFARLRYELATNSTAFGSVTAPGEGTFAYDCGTVVNLVASPDVRCRFVGWSGDVEGIGDINAAETTIIMDGNRSVTADFEVIPMVTAGIWHTVGLKSDGTVLATGYNANGQCEVDEWEDMVQVAAGERHTVGLMADGTVVAVGGNNEGECNVSDWADIVQIDAGRYFTVGLKSDGTVVTAGSNVSGQCAVEDWTGIVRITAGFHHTLGLRPDGTVVAVGGNWGGQCNVSDWTDIIQVGAGGHHTLGLKSDGTVLAVGRENYGELQVGWWRDIVQVAGGCQISLGLKSDGSMMVTGWCDSLQCHVTGWTDVVQIDAGIIHTLGLRSDGTVVSAGSNGSGQRNVGDWILS